MINLSLNNKELLKYSNNPYYFCEERILSTVATSFYRSHEMIFAGVWNFRYLMASKRHPDKIGIRIHIDYSSLNIFLEKYHGIKTIKLNTNNTRKIVEDILAELENNKIVQVEIDRFYVREIKEEERLRHIISPFIIMGYDNNKGFILIDVHIAEGSQYKSISIENFLSGCKNCYKYCLVKDEQNEISLEEILDITINNIGHSRRTFIEMEQMAEDVKFKFSFSTEIEGYLEPLYVPFHFSLYKLYRSRMVFANTLQYINKCNDIKLFEQIINRLKFLSLQWDMLRNNYIKMFYKNAINNNSSIMADKILQNAELEEKTYNEFINTINNRENILTNKIITGKANDILIEKNNSEKNLTFLDISHYFNNKGFGDLSDGCNADLTKLGHYYYKSEFPETGILEDGNNFFKVYADEGAIYDNISCEKQIINILPGDYKEIRFLGCSEYGSNYDNITLKYKDGTEKEHFFGFPDWILPPLYDEKIMWTGKSIQINENIKQIIGNDVYLYSTAIHIKDSLDLECIVLPDCKNLHIFAITVSS